MNKISLLIGLVLLTGLCFAQIPTTPFEITSILVDGCDGGNEGKNEMVALKIGPNDINVNDITASWPNNPFLGFCTSPQATTNLQILNDNIVQCGQLLEPPGGILPAGSNVMIITSTDYTPLLGYFANLTEVFYVIFQCAGNTGGHFANYNGSIGTRTLTMNYLPSGYVESVSYQRELLLNPEGDGNGTDGDAVAFEFDGTASYFNNGCQAPFIPTTVSLTGKNSITNTLSACIGGIISLIGEISGEYTSFSWSGGTGTFLDPDSLNTEYQLGPGDVGSITLTLTVNAPCATLVEQIQFTVESPNSTPLAVSPSGLVNICSGQSIDLVASGGTGSYQWSTSELSSSINVSNAGVYTVTSENACQSDQISVTVNVGNNLSVQSTNSEPTCAGKCDASIALQTTGGSGNYSYSWSANAGNQTSSTISNLCAGTYLCSIADLSGSCTADISVTITDPAPVPIDYQKTPNQLVCSNKAFEISVLVLTTGASLKWEDGTSSETRTISPITDTEYAFEVSSGACSKKDTVKITVMNCIGDSSEVLFPNIFTPDGDSKNDLFLPLKLKNVTVESFVVLNRWGNVMLEIKDHNITWDGKVDGKEANDGTYFYLLNYKDIAEKSLQIHGFIQLIRK